MSFISLISAPAEIVRDAPRKREILTSKGFLRASEHYTLDLAVALRLLKDVIELTHKLTIEGVESAWPVERYKLHAIYGRINFEISVRRQYISSCPHSSVSEREIAAHAVYNAASAHKIIYRARKAVLYITIF